MYHLVTPRNVGSLSTVFLWRLIDSSIDPHFGHFSRFLLWGTPSLSAPFFQLFCPFFGMLSRPFVYEPKCFIDGVHMCPAWFTTIFPSSECLTRVPWVRGPDVIYSAFLLVESSCLLLKPFVDAHLVESFSDLPKPLGHMPCCQKLHTHARSITTRGCLACSRICPNAPLMHWSCWACWLLLHPSLSMELLQMCFLLSCPWSKIPLSLATSNPDFTGHFIPNGSLL